MIRKNTPEIVFAILFSLLFHASTAQEVVLNWEFRESGSNTWYPAIVPGSVYTSLKANNLIPDPTAACNDSLVSWVAEKDWEFRSQPFRVNPELLSSSRQLLNLGYIDGVCDVALNGHKLTTLSNSFLQIATEINDYLKAEGNVIELYFHSPRKSAGKQAKEYGFIPPGGERVFMRSPQYQWGSDWAPELPSLGIGANPELLCFDTFLIRHFRVDTEYADNTNAYMQAVFTITSLISTTMQVTFSFGNVISLDQSMELKKGTHDYSLPFEVTSPFLWWPHDQGIPFLYETKLRVNAAGQESLVERKTGICTAELVREKDAKGEGFLFQINGRRIFARGSNYVPATMFFSDANDSAYLRILSDVKESNMNMIRVQAGGAYEKERFYNLCDSLGILVWQDFMFTDGMYPGDETFLDNIWDEAIQNGRRISAHPCVALFCGNNEILEGWEMRGWKEGMKKKHQQKLAKAYKDIFKRMLPLAVRYSGYKPYLESSPAAGIADSPSSNSGDKHDRGLHYTGDEPFTMFAMHVPRFMSEFGIQSYPTRSVMSRITSAGDHQQDFIPGCHNKRSEEQELMNAQINEWLRASKDLSLFAYGSQVLQAEAMKIGIETQRQAKPFCMGSLYRQLNDCCPMVSSSGIDYSGSWKPMQYVVKRAFHPLGMHLYQSNGRYLAGMVSDLPFEINDTLLWKHQDYRGKILKEGDIPIALNPNSSAIFELSTTISVSDSSKEFIVASWQGCMDCPEYTYHFLPPGRSSYSTDGISWSAEKHSGRYVIRLYSTEFKRGLWMESNAAGKFSDNYLDLLPGEARELYFTPFDPLSEPVFECITLGGTIPASN